MLVLFAQHRKLFYLEWYTKRRADKDLIIKLHTGEGKTLVGLLLLQSLLNSKEGPCLYICPNKYLVRQVCSEADKFGIPFVHLVKVPKSQMIFSCRFQNTYYSCTENI
ncbi:MAG: DEAD/DEAH box helicase [Blautia sp.]